VIDSFRVQISAGDCRLLSSLEAFGGVVNPSLHVFPNS